VTTVVDFDDALFDAEVLMERAGVRECTAIELGRLLGALNDNNARQKVNRLMARGRIPRPATPSTNGYRTTTPARWSRQQVLRIVAQEVCSR